MRRLSVRGQRWLKIVHLVFACAWLGGALALLLILFLARPAGGDELYAVQLCMTIVDDFLIIPGALGCLFTGVLYGIATNWGFFRHRWLTVKWIATVTVISFGTFWLGPWLNANAALAKAERAAAWMNPDFVHNQAMNMACGPVQLVVLVGLVWVSVAKPWKKRA
jgi:uncharacterized membrane protein